ncbi:MAG: phosphoribosylanthranilate isomerase [Alphaproteobacteria bacterium]|nr:phosphoribosylanthranilate isomerase [Alphaproteobacteria bacterium]|tara:strand:+ start:3890 stop:4534 length:645 start_codon:yes stop_codon:yes gene_type:complete
MAKHTQAKICGIHKEDALQSCITHGADFIGFVFYPRSPRHIDIQKFIALAAHTPTHIQKVGLFVNADDALITECAPHLDIIQLHGDETPTRCAEIKTLSGCKIMKALAIRNEDDLAQINVYDPVCDWLLFDAKPSDKAGTLPGGNGLSFDWSLLNGLKTTKPWMLAGGLDANNVNAAIKLVHPHAVDVSSGVESRLGHKDDEKIKQFISAVKRG